MTDTQLIAAVLTGFSLLLLMWLLHLFNRVLIDNLRDQLFALRDEMFLYAYDQGLAEDPAHTNLRIVMNKLIRYAHRVSFIRLMFVIAGQRLFSIRPTPAAVYAEWLTAVAALPTEQARRLREFHAQAMLLIMRHMITGSSVLLLGAAVFAIKHVITRSTQRLWDRIARSFGGRVHLDLLELQALNAR